MGICGVNKLWCYGFLAIGGLATVLVSVPPVHEAWSAGGIGILISGLFLAAAVSYTHLTLPTNREV